VSVTEAIVKCLEPPFNGLFDDKKWLASVVKPSVIKLPSERVIVLLPASNSTVIGEPDTT